MILAAAGALYALGWAPGGRAREDLAVGLVVALQLFSLAPVGIVSLSTMRYGRFDRVLTQAVVYVVGLGAAFFGVAGALWALRSLAPDAARSPLLVSAWLVVTLVVMERATVRLRSVASGWVQSDRRRSRQRLNRFGDRVRTYPDAQTLADDTVIAVGEALGARSVVLFVTSPVPADPSRWVRAAYRPEPPFFTAELMDDVWRMIDRDGGGTMWSRTAELDESEWPEEQGDRLHRLGVALIVPVTSGRGESVGALILARKAQRSAVYNLEDAEMLRALCGQIALAVDRLGLLERERALVRESAEAQLTALRAQINPHFLFNALNTIAALIASRPAEAEATVQHLASLFRHVLKTGGQPFLPLATEAELVRQYLAIECARFGDRLEVEEDWEPATFTTPVPAFAIQTLVENAVKHGIERRRGNGRVRVGSRRMGDTVVVEVFDNGPGIPALFGATAAPGDPGDGLTEPTPADDGSPAFYGIGLRNVAARLARLYGRTDLLSITSDPESGTLAQLTLPLTTPD
jgi:signal transduction histidine kinase